MGNDDNKVEARAIAARVAEVLSPAGGATRAKAIEALFQTVGAIAAEVDLRAGTGDSGGSVAQMKIWTENGERSVLVQMTRDGSGLAMGYFMNTVTKNVPFHLQFDPATQGWEGTEEDDFLIPIPGEPKRRRRPALAVVFAAVERALAKGE